MAPALVDLLFVSVPFSGHVSPAIAVARACAARAAAPAPSCASSGASDADAQESAGARIGAVRFAAPSSERARVEAAGLEFVDLGEPAPEAKARMDDLKARGFAMGAKADGLKLGAQMFSMMGETMLPPLLAAIRDGPARGTGVIVNDFATFAGHEAAEILGLPLVVLHQAPLGMALMTGGQNDYNLFSHVPLEVPGPLMQSERLGLAQRLLNPLLKRLAASKLAAASAPFRSALRAGAGLDPAPAGMGPWGPAPAVTRQLHLVSGSAELETERPLPPGWHLTGQHNVNFSGSRFPVTLVEPDEAAAAAPDTGARDSGKGGGRIDRFLRDAQAAGEPVVYVATGTVVQPTKSNVDAITAAIAATPGARFIWSLPKSCQHLLPGDGWAPEGRALVLPWVPQQALLSHDAVKVFVTHGGLNSTYEGASAGKAMVALPYFADQPINGQHLVNKGVGSMIPNPWELQAADLAAHVQALLADKAAQRRAAELGAKLRANPPGAARAADLIAGFVAEGAAQ